jgi:hypothetical protein
MSHYEVSIVHQNTWFTKFRSKALLNEMTTIALMLYSKISLLWRKTSALLASSIPPRWL